MLVIGKKIVVDENNKPVPVLMDIETFAKIERILEDYALGKLIAEVEDEEALDMDTAKAYYRQLRDAD
jgi:hypothetical protein